MQRRPGGSAEDALRFDFGEMTPFTNDGGSYQRGRLRLVAPAGLRRPDKYRVLDVKRRRAQIRARRALGLS